MQKVISFFVCSFLILPFTFTNLAADGSPVEDTVYSTESCKNIKGFTGKVTRDRVRLRLNPTTDSPVVREMDKGEMLLIVDEVDDFYAVTPPRGIKAFLYRTYVLDGVIEGNRVNVRLDPHLEAPVIAQLNTGDRIDGVISDKNAKWMEISPPETTFFYIATDYIERVGDAKYLGKYEAREEEVNDLLNGTYIQSQAELQKHFSDIEAEQIVENYQSIIEDYTDFPTQVRQAKKYLTEFNQAYLRKKVDYLEAKTTKKPDQQWKSQTAMNIPEKSPVQPPQSAAKIYENWVNEKFANEVNARMALWIPVEIAYYERWAETNNERSIQDYYVEQKGDAIALRGVIEAYDRPVRNKPGDYLLVNRTNRLPIAYLYSTHVNLSEKVGHEVTVHGVLRPNHNFAYPAYFVIEAE